MRKYFANGWSKLTKLRGDQHGDVAITFALMSLALMVAVGASVDFGRWLNARTQTLSAMDTAVLAAGKVLQADVTKTIEALETARAFYAENIKHRIEVGSDSVDFTIGLDGMSVSATGNAAIDTSFLRLAHIDTLPLLATDGSDFSKAELANTGGFRESLEISLMLDVTGSMAGDKLDTLKQAAQDLIDRVIDDNRPLQNARMAIVPFADSVRPPADTLTLVRGSPAQSIAQSFYHWLFGNFTLTYNLTPCVAERTGEDAYTDATPYAQRYVLPVYTNSGTCTLAAGNEVMPLTDDKSLLLDAVDGLEADGGTAGHLGTAWSWYTLSPHWNAIWGGNDHAAADYDDGDTKKIAILMTDGEYNTQYAANGLSTSAQSAANGASAAQARALCAAMKAVGITLYTVGFELDPVSEAAETLAICATDENKAYSANDGDELLQAFRNITTQLSQLYLSQ